VVMLGVPYKGSAPAISDTIGGQAQFMFPSLFTALPHVKSGKLRALAVAGPKRSALLPDVPTLKESGIDGVDVQQWYGFFAPAKTPKPIIDQINKVLNQVLADKEIIKRMEDHDADVVGCSREEETFSAPETPVVSHEVNGELVAERLCAAQHGHSGGAAHLNGEAAHPVGEQTKAIDHEVHHHDVVGVLGPAQSGFNNGKTGLHEHDQKPGDQGPGEIGGGSGTNTA